MTAAGPGGQRPIVFVSHSGFEGETRTTLEAIVDALRAAHFTPLLDRETIVPGTDFHERVQNMIAVCHAAVIYMNRRAYELESKWVFNEVSRLQDRGKNRFFQIVVVYADGLEPKCLEAGDWGITGLSKRDAIFPLATPAATAGRVVEALEHTRESLAAGVVGGEIVKLLRRDVKDETLLRELAAKLTPDWISGDPFIWVARRLVAGGEYTPVRDFLRELAAAKLIDTARTLMAVVLPFMWVPPRVAETLPVAIGEGRPVGINSERPRTTRAYVHCSSTVWPTWHVAEVGAGFGGESLDELVDEARREIDYVEGEVEFFASEPPEPASEDEDRRPLVILAVPCPGFDPETVERLERGLSARRKVGVVLQGGDVDWATVPPAMRERIVYLEPELVREVELRALRLMETQPVDLANFYRAHLESLRGP